MFHAFGARSLSFASHVDPVLMNVMKEAIGICPVDFGFTEDQSRTVAQQNAKFHSGASQLPAGPKARHMIQSDGFSKAVDAVPWVDGRFQWLWPQIFQIAFCVRQAAIRQNVRIRWGGVWDRNLNDIPATTPADIERAEQAYITRHPGRDFVDGPHYELPL